MEVQISRVKTHKLSGCVQRSAVDIPTVPTKVSAFTNDAGYLTEHQDLSEYAKKTEIPSKLPNPHALTINGKTYDPVEVDIWQGNFMALYDLGEITKPAATPATGDTTPVMLLSFLCLSTLAGIGILLSKKRIAR